MVLENILTHCAQQLSVFLTREDQAWMLREWIVDRVLCLALHRFIQPEDASSIAQRVLEN